MKKLIILGILTVMILTIGVGCTEGSEENIGANNSREVSEDITILNEQYVDLENPSKEITKEDTSEIIKNEIIISVTEEYDGKITEELKNLNVVSVENIFEIEDTIMYLIKTDIYVDDIITKLEELSYVKYAEYNKLVEYIDPILEVK